MITEAFTIDPNRPSGVYLDFHPALAPKKAAILPLTAKDEHPVIATKLYMELRNDFAVDLDIKQNIGKRYARQDEIGTPYCFTIDDQTVADQTVTVRERNTMKQERIGLDHVAEYLRKKYPGDLIVPGKHVEKGAFRLLFLTSQNRLQILRSSTAAIRSSAQFSIFVSPRGRNGKSFLSGESSTKRTSWPYFSFRTELESPMASIRPMSSATLPSQKRPSNSSSSRPLSLLPRRDLTQSIK